MRSLELWIGGVLADVDSAFDVELSHTVDDSTSPAAVQNTYSKSIVLRGTPTNDSIFGNIWRMDWVRGSGFDPLVRVEARIMSGGAVVDTGYIKLDEVSLGVVTHSYHCTYYGGLGDFFYGLKYKSDGSLLTLADIAYGIESSSGEVLDPATELDFTITRDFVKASWDRGFVSDGRTLNDFITFAPVYRGEPEDFDSEHVLINTEGTDIFTTEVTQEEENEDGDKEDVTYTTSGGWMLGQLPASMDEWTMGDLRSYLQQPCVRLRRVFEAIFAHSGYDVVLDEGFFNSDNPYWDKSYIVLPRLGTALESQGGDEYTSPTESFGSLRLVDGKTEGYVVPTDTATFPMTRGTQWVFTGFNVASSLTFDFTVGLTVSGLNTTQDLYLTSKLDFISTTPLVVGGFMLVRASIYGDTSGITPLWQSPVYALTNETPKMPTLVNQFDTPWGRTDTFEYVYGVMKYDSTSGSHVFTINGSQGISFSASNLPRTEEMVVMLEMLYVPTPQSPYDAPVLCTSPSAGNTQFVEGGTYSGTFGGTVRLQEPSGLSSGGQVTKGLLFDRDSSCLDYVLDYAKLFGLHWERDAVTKTIYCRSRQTYYDGTVLDISGRVDRGDVTVKPTVFDNKWYLMAHTMVDTSYSERYSTKYGQVYGQQRIDTGTQFNQDVTEVFDGTSYSGLIDVSNASSGYRTYYTSGGAPVPEWYMRGLEYELYADGGKSITHTDYGSRVATLSSVEAWSSVDGHGLAPLPCMYDKDGGGIDLRGSLLMYNGNIPVQTVGGKALPLWLTDDLDEMVSLNGGERCWLYTTQERDSLGNFIASRVESLPVFNRYISSAGMVSHTFDFGVPREVYVDGLAYPAGCTLYDRFWRAWFNDRLDASTRVVRCRVDLTGIQYDSSLFRRFYWFDGSLWVLNAVDGYSIVDGSLTECEFIKVQDKDNYVG